MSIVCVSYFDKLDRSKKSKRYRTNSGSHFKPTYEYRVIDGIDTLVKCGESNIFEEIQSHKLEADINCIIARFLNGETDLLNTVPGMFGDFRDCPDNYAEIFDRVQQCENVFANLPVEIKEEFDNSYKKFWSSFGDDHFNEVFEKYNSSASPVDVKEPVMEGVNDNAE